MRVRLDHTIVHVRDGCGSATQLADLLGVAPPTQYGPFLVEEAESDEIFGRIQSRGLAFWADPGRSRPGEINTNDGGRGVYWEDPSGHFLEILTRPYGGGG